MIWLYLGNCPFPGHVVPRLGQVRGTGRARRAPARPQGSAARLRCPQPVTRVSRSKPAIGQGCQPAACGCFLQPHMSAYFPSNSTRCSPTDAPRESKACGAETGLAAASWVAQNASAGWSGARLSHADPANLLAKALPELLLKASKNNPPKHL